MIRGSISTWVTFEPRRANDCASSAADRAAAEDDQPLRQVPELPDGIRCDVADLLDARNRRHERRRTRGDDDRARGQRLLRAVGALDLDRPRRGDLRLALHDVDAEARVALGRVVRRDGPDHAVHPVHDVLELEVRRRAPCPELARALDVRQELRGADQRLRRHAAEVQAVAAHLVLLDQRHLGLDRGADIGRHEPRGAGPDHDQVAIELRRLPPPRVHLTRLQPLDHPLRDQREDAEQDERADKARRHEPGQRVDARDLRPGVHVHDRAGEHAELAHPVERPRRDGREAHDEIDHEERERRHEPQREQVERALFLDAAVDRRELVAELRLDRSRGRGSGWRGRRASRR